MNMQPKCPPQQKNSLPVPSASVPVLPKHPLENQVQSVNKSVTQASKINVQPKGLTQPKKSLPVPSASVLVLPKHPLENQVQSTNKSVTRPSKMTVQPKGILQPKNSLPVLEKRASPSKFDMNKEYLQEKHIEIKGCRIFCDNKENIRAQKKNSHRKK